jgi:hypothetical protein
MNEISSSSVTAATMAIRALEGIKELYVELLKEPHKADHFFNSIVKDMQRSKMSGENIVSCFREQMKESEVEDIFLLIGPNLSVSLPAMAYSLQALEAHAANDQESAWYYAAEANYWHGVAIAMKGSKDETISGMARRAANARHQENRSLKQEAIDYYLKNHHSFSSKDKVAFHIAENIIPSKFATVRDWLKGIKPE